MTHFKFLTYIVYTMLLSVGFSCSEQETPQWNSNGRDNSSEVPIFDEIVLPQNVMDSLESVEAFVINDFNDFSVPLKTANGYFSKALENGKYDYIEAIEPLMSRQSIEELTTYVTNPISLMEEEHQKMFFKSKFSSTFVNKINSVVSSEFKLSSGTTYCCYWSVYYLKLQQNDGMLFSPLPSPKCALDPAKKDEYIERNYAMNTKILYGKTYIELYSFELEILYKDTKSKTPYLGIRYPRVIDPSPWPGYEFKYIIYNP